MTSEEYRVRVDRIEDRGADAPVVHFTLFDPDETWSSRCPLYGDPDYPFRGFAPLAIREAASEVQRGE
jgi:hypothetical protein